MFLVVFKAAPWLAGSGLLSCFKGSVGSFVGLSGVLPVASCFLLVLICSALFLPPFQPLILGKGHSPLRWSHPWQSLHL